MEVRNSQLNNDTIQALNTLIELDINAVSAFKLTRIIKDISEIVELKLKMEKKILDKCSEKDSNGEFIRPLDENGNIIPDAVNIIDVTSFTSEMDELMNMTHNLSHEKLNFEDLNLQTAKVKDLMKRKEKRFASQMTQRRLINNNDS
jgi:hypothetical protein